MATQSKITKKVIDEEVSTEEVITDNLLEEIDEENKERIENIKEQDAVKIAKKVVAAKKGERAKASKNLEKAVYNDITSKQEADKSYMVNHTRATLIKCKNDDVETIVGDKIYSLWFGKVYTFLFNCVPVTIRFDGTRQEFPKFLAKRIREKLSEVANSNFPKEENDKVEI